MKIRNIYKNTYLKLVIREAKKNNCICKITRSKHFKIRITNIENGKTEVMTISSSPSDNKYDIFLENELKNYMRKITNSDTEF